MDDYLRECATLWVISGVKGMGRRSINRMMRELQRVGISLREALSLGPYELAERAPALENHALAALQKVTENDLAEGAFLLEALSETVGIITLHHQDYPRQWKKMLKDDAPPFLYYQGNPELLKEPACAVVGRRKVSPEGAEKAFHCGARIAEAGCVLVSGGASGVDMAGHNGALDAGKSSIVLLPQGIHTYAIPDNWHRPADEGRLLLMSEYMPATGWHTAAALARNATIAAQARLVCVVEPRKTGGSIATARHAIQQGKAVLIPATDPLPADVEACALPMDELPRMLNEVMEMKEVSQDLFEGLGDF